MTLGIAARLELMAESIDALPDGVTFHEFRAGQRVIASPAIGHASSAIEPEYLFALQIKKSDGKRYVYCVKLTGSESEQELNDKVIEAAHKLLAESGD